jgi:hypothetical protein
LVILHLADAAELEFPFQRPLLFRGLEAAQHVVADPASLRRAYLSELRKHLDAVQFCCREQEIDYRLVRTDQPFDVTLSSLLTSRAKRVR